MRRAQRAWSRLAAQRHSLSGVWGLIVLAGLLASQVTAQGQVPAVSAPAGLPSTSAGAGGVGAVPSLETAGPGGAPPSLPGTGSAPRTSSVPGTASVPGTTSVPGSGLGSSSPAAPANASGLGSEAAPGTSSASASTLRTQRSGGVPNLPSDGGQYWEEYDLRPYTKELTTVDRPQQAVVDWILRDTGTDVWFTDPFGFINADRNTLRVYHNEKMQQLVRQSYERFVNGTTVPQAFGMRLLAIGNPNWRTRGHVYLKSVPAQSPGVQAYLASKENYALLMAMLRGRGDFRELASVSINTFNGQPQVLEQLRSRNFVRDFQRADGSVPPYLPVTGEIPEGYRLQVSPLMSLDKKSIDLMVKCHIDQVERFSSVTLDLPLAGGKTHSGQVQVPQMASWRLHERFRWPADEVLLLSCGVVASPQAVGSTTLLGQGSSLVGLDRILPQSGQRADALLVIEYLGDANRAGAPAVPGASPTVPGGVAQAPGTAPAALGAAGQVPANTAARPSNNPLSRGRY